MRTLGGVLVLSTVLSAASCNGKKRHSEKVSAQANRGGVFTVEC